MAMDAPPGNLVTFGPDSNCTLELCPVEWSVYQYRPSLPSNIVFLVLYVVAMLIHIYLGIRWRSWGFMVPMILGCLFEIAGYVGRIVMYNNPFDFIGFMIQIVFITCGPIFYTASIYVTLSKTIIAFGRDASRLNPKLFYWIFIPADVVCLVLQAAGGALSTVSEGSSDTGVNIALAGLGLQVAVLFIFCLVFGDYLIRYFRMGSATALTMRIRLFFGFFSTSIILILGRCAYRCYELSKGYQNSDLITDEALFIGLEGVLIILAVFALCIGHPGFLFSPRAQLAQATPIVRTDEESLSQKNEPATHNAAF